MAKVIAGMTVSIDGFVADRNGSNERLYPDLEDLHGGDFMNRTSLRFRVKRDARP